MKKLLLLPAFLLSFQLFSQERLLHCGADELRIETLKKNPKIAEAVIRRDQELETFTKTFVEDFYQKKTRSATYVIPIVFHVIHNYGPENISDAQIMDGLSILNKTFRKQLADTGSIVAAFKPIHADCDIEFALAKRDPSGNCHSGINRIASPLTSIGDHSVKSIIQWPPDKYLNVYICAQAAGLAGHCVWPGDADTIPAWDGIVIASNYVGSIGTSSYTTSVAFAHECGHYLNLQHIWGGNNVPGFYYYPCADPGNDCSIDDGVSDTPQTIGWVSCNLSGASCGSPLDNVQNTMDYSYCNRMFTIGQKARMQACLNSSIANRDNLWTTTNLLATGVLPADTALCKADFMSDKKVVCQSSANTIAFTNTSYNGTFTSVQWQFPGGTPSSSMLNNPTVTYTTPGKYDVTLKVVNGTDSTAVIRDNYITVLPSSGTVYPYSEGFETTTSLDGTDWYSNSFDSINEWQLTSAASFSGTKSVMLNNFSNTESTKDELHSKVINMTGSSSQSISFKYAYARKDTSDDARLQLYITSNCNTSWIQRALLTGSALETAPLSATSFTPTGSSEWKSASVTIPAGWLTSGFRFKFVFTSNGGNNVYVDDINIYTNTGVENLASASSLELFPNPAAEMINVHFALGEEKQIGFTIVNTLGQVVFNMEPSTFTEGEHIVTLNVESLEAGTYILRVGDAKKVLVISDN